MAPAFLGFTLEPRNESLRGQRSTPAVEVFAIQLRDAVLQPIRLLPEKAAFELVRDVAVLPLPHLGAQRARRAHHGEWGEVASGWSLSLATLPVRRISLCGLVREVFWSRTGIRIVIDDGTAVAKAQCTGSLSQVLETSTASLPTHVQHSALNVGVLVFCSGRVDWYGGECICMLEQIRVFSQAESVRAEICWWKRVIERQYQLARERASSIFMPSSNSTESEKSSIYLDAHDRWDGIRKYRTID
jgi:hypothetical protein